MRSCPECGNRWTRKGIESKTETIHLCDDCMEDFQKKAAGNDRELIRMVSEAYGAWGYEHAGERHKVTV